MIRTAAGAEVLRFVDVLAFGFAAPVFLVAVAFLAAAGLAVFGLADGAFLVVVPVAFLVVVVVVVAFLVIVGFLAAGSFLPSLTGPELPVGC
jgi:hypothetical protein